MRFLLIQLHRAIIATLLLSPLAHVAMAAALAQSSRSQSEPGKLVGMIVDQNEARITTAKILITGRGLSREVTVDEEGFFQIDLPQGNYRVTITANGFRTARRNVFVKSNAVTALNVQLVVASMSITRNAHNKSLDRSGGSAWLRQKEKDFAPPRSTLTLYGLLASE